MKGEERLIVPLMTMIDYRGYRILAQAFIQLGETSLIYGSCDAGKSFQHPKLKKAQVSNSPEIGKADREQEVVEEINEICKKLNLKEHKIKTKIPVSIFTPIDLEIHSASFELP